MAYASHTMLVPFLHTWQQQVEVKGGTEDVVTLKGGREGNGGGGGLLGVPIYIAAAML